MKLLMPSVPDHHVFVLVEGAMERIQLTFVEEMLGRREKDFVLLFDVGPELADEPTGLRSAR
jgi:hypothetical protein